MMLQILFVLIFLLSAMIPTAANAADSDVLVSGVNEFETGMSDDGSGMTTSDPAISKIELQFNSPESRPFGALLRLKHEPDEDEVDEAYLRYQFGGKNKFAIIAGESYTPFGHFDSSLITDSMTLTVGESRLQGLKFESDRGDWTASVFASTDSSDSSSRVASGAGINFHRGKDWRGYGLGIAAISNIAIADEIHSALSSPGVNSKTVPALAAHAIYGDGTNQIIVDAVTATERFAPGELAFAGDGAQPGAWRTEVARHFQFLDKPMTVAASWQQSHEALR